MRQRSSLLAVIVAVLTLLAGAPAGAGFSGTDVFLPSVGRAQGIASWYTAMWVHNPGTAPAIAQLYFLARDQSNLGATPATLTIPPGDTARFPNALVDLFGREGFGAIRVVSASPLLVTSRIFSREASETDRDSRGQDFVGIPASFAISSGQRTQLLGVYLTQPSAASELRFNFGFVETSGHDCTVAVTPVDATGAPLAAARAYPVRALEQRQFQVKDEFPTLSTDNARLDVAVTAGAGRVIAFGSAITNGSQDPTTFEMQFADELLAASPATGITGVTAGAGLTGGGSAGSVTLAVGAGAGISVGADNVAVADGGITSPMIAPHAVGSGHLANAAVQPAHLNATGSPGTGQVPSYNGSNWTWITPSGGGGLTLPFGGAATGAGAAFAVANGGSGAAVSGAGAGGPGVAGSSTDGNGLFGTSRAGWGVYGANTGNDNWGALGGESGAMGFAWSPGQYGVMGQTGDGEAVAVHGVNANGNTGSLGGAHGVAGRSGIPSRSGVYGESTVLAGYGVYGANAANGAVGYLGGAYGAWARHDLGIAFQAETTEGLAAVWAGTAAPGGFAVAAYNSGLGLGGALAGADAFHPAAGVLGDALSCPTCLAGLFLGNVDVSGTLTKGGGAFRIDHPLDPANRVLQHSFVESPDMKNIYDGVVVTDAQGRAVVELPAWFGALNRDFRYQLTVIGRFAQAIVEEEIADNRFTIRTNLAQVKVSWQVTGIRQDAYANAHRIVVEEDKPAAARGTFLHPLEHGAADAPRSGALAPVATRR